MLLFLLPLLFNPFSLIVNWLPGLYLAAWPIIIQTLGRETLVTHALVLILFILTCDIARQMMHKTIGFDLLSFPLGIVLLVGLASERGTFFLGLLKPIFSGLLLVVEPLFLLIEAFIFMDMIRSFNKWISEKANDRDEDAHDISSWEPPLSRGAVLARIFIILITITSYVGVYFVIHESKSLLGDGQDIPVNFNHAIAALVTLQLIAFSTTIYKDEGVLSESAIVALLASVPIFIASWSYYHLRETTNAESSWTSYLPSSIFGSGSSGPDLLSSGVPVSVQTNLGEGFELFSGEFSRRLPLQLQLPAPLQNLTLDKLAKYYFGPDFWYILAGRFLCLFWWSLKVEGAASDSSYFGHARASIRGDQTEHVSGNDSRGSLSQARSVWRSLGQWLPIRRRTLIKVLLVLAYAQMIIQQMDNKEHLQAQIGLLGESSSDKTSSACCHSHDEDPASTASNTGEQLGAWFNCMWTSAKNCASYEEKHDSFAAKATKFEKYSARTKEMLWRLVDYLAGVVSSARNLVGSLDLALLVSVWFARLRSVIVQRLAQSMFVHLHYINYILSAKE